MAGRVAYRLTMCIISFYDISGDHAMTRTSSQALAVARPVIKGLITLNVIYALGLAGALVWSFFIQGWPARPLGFEMTHAHPLLGQGLRAIAAARAARAPAA